MSVDERASQAGSMTVLALPAAPDAGRSPGSLIVAWQHPTSRRISPVGLLEHGLAPGYRFRYLRQAPAVEDFAPFIGFPAWERTYTAERLFPLFAQRIMSPRRPDYSQYLRQLHLSSEATPWEQLARSEGRRTGDTVQVLPIPTVSVDGSSRCWFLLQGARHMNPGADLPALHPGDALTVRNDPENPVNPDAMVVCTQEGASLGYVPDLLLEHLRALRCEGPVDLTVTHVNGREAPAHLRLLVQLDGRAPSGYAPMTGPRWDTY